MMSSIQRLSGDKSRPLRILGLLFVFMIFLATLVLVIQRFTKQSASAAVPSTVSFEVFNRETGAPVSDYRFLVNEDIANEDPSITNPRSYSPIHALGDSNNPATLLDEGKYLVTIMGGTEPFEPGDGADYKLGGAYFEVDGAGTPVTVRIDLVPNPLPLATLRVRVFHDNNSLDQEDNIPIESGLNGFPVVISDPTGEVGVDFFGNPLCTEYDANGNPIPGTGGQCLTGPGPDPDNPTSDGWAVIPNLPPLKYEVEVIPPDVPEGGRRWIQTTTIEGTHVIDAWLEEGASGYSTEVGFLTGAVWVGFVQECSFGDTADSCPTNDQAGTGTINGRVRKLTLDTDAPGDIELGPTVYRPFVGLNNLSGNDEQVYTARGNPDGTFTIPNVPPGQYQLVYWDFPQDYIIQFRTVDVGPGEVVNMGDVGIPRWFGAIQGYVYLDNGLTPDGTPLPNDPNGNPAAGNGIRDCRGADPHDLANCEPGIPNTDLDVRFKDGTIRYATFTDSNGFYEFPEYFEWEHFLVWEIGFGRMYQGGTTAYFTDADGMPIGYPYNPENSVEPGLGALLQAQMTWAGSVNWVDTGKTVYDLDNSGDPASNGGISGIVYYGTTRNESDVRFAFAEDYEPGVPDVMIEVYNAVLDSATGQPQRNPDGSFVLGSLVDAVPTDAWDGNHPTDCVYEYPVPGSGVFIPDPDCLELPNRWNQIKDGVFDGGWAVEGLIPGTYIVQVIPPAGYRVITDDDQNTSQGDDFPGPPEIIPAPCGVTGECSQRAVRVIPGWNAPAEFWLMTDNGVPPPGMIRGLLVDDLSLDVNPDSPLYVEKRGIPNTPIGVLDFQGNEIARVYSDESGYWEVLLPSSYTAHCPTPGGVCPGMYRVVGNYPGTLEDPDPQWNPNYGSLYLVFDVWPGKTTYADVALLPTTFLLGDPSSGYLQAPRCDLPLNTPEITAVSQPYGYNGQSITIYGENFGTQPGLVLLDGSRVPPPDINSWSDTEVNVTIQSPRRYGGAGPKQLTITTRSGFTSLAGITYHFLNTTPGPGNPVYNPPLVHVGPGQAYTSLQDGIDAANPGDLVIAHPAEYFETIILDKNVKVQGHGPGATVMDGRFFNFGGMTPQDFLDRVAVTAYSGPESVPMGQVLTVLAEDGEFSSSYTTQVDGFAIRSGSRVRGNVPIGAEQQGGGLYAHAYARSLEISNNTFWANSGAAGGGIILGRANTINPDAGNALDLENDNVHIHHNRIQNNGGFRLAGGVGIFNGAEDYEIDHNFVCGNFSAEYGGGISHFGMSPGGHIHDNRIIFNYGFDEGGGVMIAGELANNPEQLSPGSGDVLIERNLIQANLTNDDGGGIRLLQPVEGPVDIINNMVVSNISTDFGGGISLDDALNVNIINNTIAKNISTSTAEDADRSSCAPPNLGSCPHGAGLVSEPHSQALREEYNLPFDSFSDPLIFNNIFWENEAFFLDGTTLPPGPSNLPSSGYIDLEVVGTTTPQEMTPNHSILSVPYGSGVGNVVGADPTFRQEIELEFMAVPFAGDPQFILIVVATTSEDDLGDFHITTGSSASDAGVPMFGGAMAPSEDIDLDRRPQGTGFDTGADEFLDRLRIDTLTQNPAGMIRAEEVITFTATANAGFVYDYTWDFGDGTVVLGSNEWITHTYQTLGLYDMLIEADDLVLPATYQTTYFVIPPDGIVYETYLPMVNNPFE